MIPETNRFNPLLCQKLFTLCVTLAAFRQTVLKTIKLHCQLCVGTVKIQGVFTHRVLSPEFEPGKSTPAERLPQLVFLIRLIVAKLPGDLFEAHAGIMMIVKKKFKPLTLTLSPFGGEREIIPHLNVMISMPAKSTLHNLLPLPIQWGEERGEGN